MAVNLYGRLHSLPVAHVRSDLHYRRLRRQLRVRFSKILYSRCFAVKVVDPGVFPVAQLLDIAHSRHDKAVQVYHSGSSIGNTLTLLHFEIVAVLINRLSWLEFRLSCGIVELTPEIGGGEDGVGVFKGRYERLLVVEVCFDYLDAFGSPGLGFGWVPRYSPDFPAGLFGVDACDGAAL